MKITNEKHPFFNTKYIKTTVVTALLASLVACENASKAEKESEKQTPIKETSESSSTASEKNQLTDVDKAAQQLDEKEYMAHINTLASDEFEGRAPSTPGGEKTVAYLESHFRSLGLEPAFTDESVSYTHLTLPTKA